MAEPKLFTAFERFRLFLGGELNHLVGWILPKTEGGDDGCDNPPEWIIYGQRPDDVTYSCTFHLSDMVAVDTVRIEPYEAVDIHRMQKTCCYLYSVDSEEEPGN